MAPGAAGLLSFRGLILAPMADLPRRRLLALGALLALFGAACATSPEQAETRFLFFEEPVERHDPWYAKVEDWQLRERRDRPQEAEAEAEAVSRAGPRTGLLRVKMSRWTQEERYALVKRITAWAQDAARRHYRFDPETTFADDPWPTTKGLMDRNGDDCDGLDLITYKLMRDFGFPREQLFRAIVKRNRDGANHMVTLWFEDPHDPWVVDATGAVSLKVRRFSQLPGWTPTKVFDDRSQFTPVALEPGSESLAQLD